MSFTLADGETLRNKIGAETHEALEAAEHPVLAIRLLELRSGLGPEPTFDTAHLQALHKHLFQDVFEWAGELRHHPFTFADGTQASMPAMHKIGGKDFAIGNEIDRGLNSLMSDLESRNFLRGLDRETFATEAADAFARMNSIHPFREGNGRTQREFFAALAERAGHPLEFGVISDERMTFVSVAAHERGDLAPMRRMFAEITDPDRVNALEVAQQAIERFRPVQAPHVTAWDGIYMATTEPGQDYSGVFSGAAGPNFMMQRDDGAIIIGNVIDLPEPRPESGARISFTSSDPHQLQPAHEQAQAPLIAAVKEWPQSVQEAVEARISTRPTFQAANSRLQAAVHAVWQDPQAVLAELRNRIDVEHRPASDFAQDLRANPEAFGSLHGNRSLFGRDDAAREKALAAVPLAVAALHDYGQVRGSLTADLTRDEERFRALMREPVNDLSPAARELVARIEKTPAHELGAVLGKGEHGQALSELRGFIANVRERFGVPGSLELDRNRLSQAIPNASPERLEAFTAGFSRISLRWTVMDFDSLFPAVDSGRGDVASFGIVDRKSRQAKYDILDNARDAAGLIVAPGLAKGIKSIDDVCGHTLGASSGTSFVSFWDEQSKKCTEAGKPAVEVLTFKNEAVAFNALLGGQIETMTAQFPVLSAFAAKFEGRAEVVPGMTYFHGYAGWAFPKNSPYLKMFQAALQKLIDDGTYGQIMGKWGLGELAVTSAAINQGTAE